VYEKGIPEFPGREVARKIKFKCENEERKNWYWTEGEERRYRMC
jgi:hypothetical protein